MKKRVAILRLLASLAAAASLAACEAPRATGISDPYETQNRAVFEGSLRLDRAILAPTARSYADIVPEPVERGINNFAANAGLPSDIVNDVLQFNIDDASANLVRFIFNTTIGIGGIFDPMKAAGLDPRPSDFGETLHVWGLGEGDYLVLPLLGPSTQRDAFGMVVDGFTNPLSYVLAGPERAWLGPAQIGSQLSARNAASSTFDALILEAADPYAQARLLYLENRRFQLGGRGASADPYSDPYASGAPDPYSAAPDPYEDPYAQ